MTRLRTQEPPDHEFNCDDVDAGAVKVGVSLHCCQLGPTVSIPWTSSELQQVGVWENVLGQRAW